MKKYVKWLLLGLWMIVIFSFSNQNGQASQNVSDGLLFNILSFLPFNLSTDIISILSILIRKMAHFIEYAILSFLIKLCLDDFKLKNVFIIALILSFSYAFFDEVHQLFIAGRSFGYMDIMIDTMGALSGIWLAKVLINEKT